MKPALVDYAEYIRLVKEAAYYNWLNGSSDSEANWHAAVSQVNQLQGKSVDITGKLTDYLNK